jgi:LacI family transcriptional regulator
LQHIMVECRRQNFELHSYYIHQGESAEQAAQQIRRNPEQERVIIIGFPAILRWLTERGYRTVCIENVTGNPAQPMVETDSRMAVQMGVDYLHTLGHQQITLLVNEPAAIISVQEKIDQFRAASPQGRVVICGTQVWDNSYQAAYAHMGEVWNVDRADRPTAIMTVSDPGAWAVLRWLSEQGVSIPRKVSVLGFEDARSSRFMHPALSTIAHPIEAIVRTAMEMLWNEDKEPHQRRLAPRLMIRESTGPALGLRQSGVA